MSELLQLYRERSGDPAFWAEPVNALTNASFLLAAACAWQLAWNRQAITPVTGLLISLAGVIGVGSFLFHTAASRMTLWLDVIPIALFQVLFLWLVSRVMLGLSTGLAAGVVIAVIGASFALMPVYQPLNGSLFYLPSLLAVLIMGGLWSTRTSEEPFLLLVAAGCFTLAIAARSIDRADFAPAVGTHFLWHLLNGIVVYLALRAWIVYVAARQSFTR